MHLNPDIDLKAFLNAVSNCQSDILFETPEGDQMNLKSELCRYVFASSVNIHRVLKGEITCKNPADLDLLKEYLRD